MVLMKTSTMLALAVAPAIAGNHFVSVYAARTWKFNNVQPFCGALLEGKKMGFLLKSIGCLNTCIIAQNNMNNNAKQ
jgi:hypothetical protein